LQRIQQLFPREEERNEDLQRLYLAAGMTPSYSAPATPPPTSAPAPPPTSHTVSHPEANDMSSLARVADITRKLYKQSNAVSVLTTAVNEIGGQWRTTRCIAAMRKPGSTPTAVQEYCADGVRNADAGSLARFIGAIHDLAISRGALTILDALVAPELQAIRSLTTELAVTSILALPLSDGADQVGVLLLMQSTPRGWNPNDVVVLRTIGEQITIALNNAGLRRLVKNLSVTDESSGLLNRASYLDLLQAEIRRGLQQATPLTVLLMHFGKAPAASKDGENTVETAMQHVGKLIAANIRQNDLAFRYDTTTVAVLLGETSEKEALLAVEKLRKIASDVRMPGKDQPVTFAAGLGQAVMKQQYDPVDIVTEIINRAEQALNAALTGSTKTVALAPAAAAAAVA